MNKDFNDQIERYFNEEMDATEKRSFEELIEVDPELKAEFDAYQLIQRNLSDTGMLRLQEKLDIIRKKKLNKKKTVFSMRFSFLVAASLAIMVSLSVFIGKRNTFTNDLAGIYSEFYQVYDVDRTFRSIDGIENKALIKALELYEKGDFKNAQIEFQKISLKEPKNYAVKFYLGITYIETKDHKKAISIFDEIAKDKGNLFLEQAEWYLGICYLKTEMKDKAAHQFTQISQSDGFYKDKAKKILDKL